MTIDSDRLRALMRQWASGVSLVTSRTDDRIHGMTVSSFTSLSLSPPLVLVSLERTTRTHGMVTDSGAFAVAILAADQQDLSDRFAGMAPDDIDRFRDISYTLTPNGCPIPDGCLAYLDCRVTAIHDVGTHTVFIGEVMSGEPLREAPPLVYFNRGYRSITDD